MQGTQPPTTPAWQIGSAIEAGVDELNARHRIDAGELIVPAAGVVITGGATATATGLGGVGLAFGGGAIGIGAAAVVAGPAVAGGAVGYGVYQGIRQIRNWSRDRTLRALVHWFQAAEQFDKAERIFRIEGMGRLVGSRRPPTRSSSAATLRLFAETTSAALVGLFCAPKGEFVVTYDVSGQHWAYVTLLGEDRFSGSGMDLRGRKFLLDDLNTFEMLLRVLGREEFVKLNQEQSE